MPGRNESLPLFVLFCLFVCLCLFLFVGSLKVLLLGPVKLFYTRAWLERERGDKVLSSAVTPADPGSVRGAGKRKLFVKELNFCAENVRARPFCLKR